MSSKVLIKGSETPSNLLYFAHCSTRSPERQLITSMWRLWKQETVWGLWSNHRFGWIPVKSCVNSQARRAALRFMFLCSRVFYSISVDLQKDPNRDEKATVCQTSLNKFFNFTLRADTLFFSSRTIWNSGDDRPWMEFNFTSLFTFFSLAHTYRHAHLCSHTNTHSWKSNLRLRKPCWKIWHLEMIRTEKNNLARPLLAECA